MYYTTVTIQPQVTQPPVPSLEQMVVTMRQGATYPILRIILEDDKGLPIDLTGVTSVTLHLEGYVDGMSLPMTIVEDELHNVVEYEWQEADTAYTGSYLAYVAITFPTGRLIMPARNSFILDII